MQDSYLTPSEIAKKYLDIGRQKADYSVIKQFVLGTMAGIFLSLACQGTSQLTHTIASESIAKVIAGLLFPGGLILIVITGSELFTGNCLLILACAKKHIKIRSMFRSLAVVYLGNMAGSIIIAALIVNSGQLDFSGGALGAYTIKVAVNKTNLDFVRAFIM